MLIDKRITEYVAIHIDFLDTNFSNIVTYPNLQ